MIVVLIGFEWNMQFCYSEVSWIYDDPPISQLNDHTPAYRHISMIVQRQICNFNVFLFIIYTTYYKSLL